MKKKLKEVRDWAQSKIDTGQEPPWAWYRYMKLVETLDQIISGMDVTLTVVGEQKEGEPIKVEMPL